MRKQVITTLIVMSLFNVFGSNAQSYETLWRKYETAQNSAQPKTALTVLNQIEEKAKKDMSFPNQLKVTVNILECKAELDAETFRDEIEKIEKQYSSLSDATEQAVAHAVIGSAYQKIASSWLFRFDDDFRSLIQDRKEEHYSHLFDNMEALADAKSEDYKPLTVLQTDGAIYAHDMLAVMVDFAESHCSWKSEEKNEKFRKAAQIYAARGNRNAEAMMLLKTMNTLDECFDLLQRCKDLDVGMDIATRCLNFDLVEKFPVDTALHVFDNENENIDADRTDAKLLFLKWVRENVKMSGAWKNLENERWSISGRIDFVSNEKVLPDRDFKIDLTYRGVKNLSFEVRKYNGLTRKNNRSELRTDGALVMMGRRIAFGDDEVNVKRVKAGLPVRGKIPVVLSLPAGHFVVIVRGAGEESVRELNVSSMAMLMTAYGERQRKAYVVDAVSGRPLSGVSVLLRNRDKSIAGRFTTAADGSVSFSGNGTLEAIRSDNDRYSTNVGYLGYTDSKVRVHEHCNIYTDRAIYRPGQTIKGNVIVYKRTDDEMRVCDDKQLTLVLTSPSGEYKKELWLTTNSLGSADYSVQLPEDAEVGRYSLTVSSETDNEDGIYEREYISIEEYKRPTFDVTFAKGDESKPQQTFALGDSVMVEGQAMMFSGVPVQSGKVKCVIECAQSSFWFWRQSHWQRLGEVELTTDSDGRFSVPVVLTDSLFGDDVFQSLYLYRVKAEVTDVSGETREGEWMIRVSKREFDLRMTSDETIDLDSDPKLAIEAVNANGEKVDVKGSYTIKTSDGWEQKGEFVANTPVSLPADLPFGRYTIVAEAKDGKGNDIKCETTIFLFHSKIKAVDIHSIGTKSLSAEAAKATRNFDDDFFYSPKNKVSESDPALLYFSPREHDAYIIYNVYANDRIVDSCQAVVDNGLHCLRIPYRKEWGDGMRVTISYVRNGHVCTYNSSFEYVEPDKKLNLSWATFRDKLQPGQKEEWVLNVKDSGGRRVSGAELMAVMYDAALDRITPHHWGLRLSFPRNVIRVWDIDGSIATFPNSYLREDYKLSKGFNRLYDYLLVDHKRKSSKALLSKGGGFYYAPRLAAVAGPASFEDGAVMEEVAESSVMYSSNSVADMSEGEAEVDEEMFDKATLRSDFSEIAFFMPHLLTDMDGQARIAFQLPESLTEWKFMGLAHTGDMHYGMLTDKIIARKEFMVRPNMPRFVRCGDKASIASSVINQSDRTISGAVRMRLINPEDSSEVLTMQKPFSVEAGKTVAVDFGFNVLDDYEGMECEIVAVSGDASDGEKNFLPVLSSKMDVTETVPFYLYDTNETTIDIANLFNGNSSTAANRKLCIEYTDNPVWMCIEALRSVKLPGSNDAVSLAASLNANTRIEEFIDKFPLLSDYENRDDVHACAVSSRDRLSALQNADGGWSWYAGMWSNSYITLSVCEQLATMPHRSEKEEQMLMTGMKFLDEREVDIYKQMKISKGSKARLQLGSFTLRYLYVSSLMPKRVVDNDVEKMRKEYLSQVSNRITDLTMYGVANVSYALRAFGYEKAANNFVESLKQHTVMRQNQGRFFATDVAYYSWMDYKIPTHTAAMRAIIASNPADDHINDMLLWLISQKQAQKWDNPMNTIDVADLLLSIYPNDVFSNGNAPKISVDGETLKAENLKLGTLNAEREALEQRKSHLDVQGNYVAELGKTKVDKGVTSLTITRKPSVESVKTVSWGFAQATFREDMSRLRPYATDELSVSRKVYVNRGGEWVEVTKKTKLSVGERIRVRHTVRADRDMDFVRLVANHPACFEPTDLLSGYTRLGSRYGYVERHDNNTVVNFDSFTRGTTTIDTEYHVTRTGEYQLGISTVECAYAKQFGGHTDSKSIVVE